MKNSYVFSMVLCLLLLNPVNAQVGKFLKNVKNSVKQELLSTPETKKTRPEPPCACDQPDLILELSQYQVDYSELNISVLDDGSILLKDIINSNYYIAKSGKSEGPLKESDPKLARFQLPGRTTDDKDIPEKFKSYISKSGGKFLITFNGKSYGPYAVINKIVLSKSGDKFIAMATENLATSQAEANKMEAAVKNAGTEAEKNQLAMQFSQQMAQNMRSVSPLSLLPKFITNISDTKVDDMTAMGSQFYNNMKYNDITMVSGKMIMDLKGNTLMQLPTAGYDPSSLILSSDNSKYAYSGYGTLTFSDSKTLTDLFNPHLIQSEGKIYIAYMYYSPGKNSIMQCKIPF